MKVENAGIKTPYVGPMPLLPTQVRLEMFRVQTAGTPYSIRIYAVNSALSMNRQPSGAIMRSWWQFPL